MEEKDKNQKTVVAFVAGLLIGGLLVWVFGIAPDKKKDLAVDMKTDTSETTGGENQAADDQGNTAVAGEKADAVPASNEPTAAVVAKGSGSITVDDQPAGDKGSEVKLGEVKMPVENGWIVVHEVNADGSLGNALGASRYSKADGLNPTTVTVLRATKAGATYKVVIYNENGDRVFDRKDDVPVTVDGGGRIEDSKPDHEQACA